VICSTCNPSWGEDARFELYDPPLTRFLIFVDTNYFISKMGNGLSETQEPTQLKIEVWDKSTLAGYDAAM
jgi:hypothetical protein